jgi:hypothetical protein
MKGTSNFHKLYKIRPFEYASKGFKKMYSKCIVNSYILYKTTLKELKQKPLSQLKFRPLLASQLIGQFTNRIKQGPSVLTGNGMKRNHPDGRRTVENSKRLRNVGK